MKKKYIAAVVLGAALNFTTFAQSFDSSPQPENVAVANLPRARENFPGINRPSIELTVTHEASGANTPPDTHDLGGSTAPGLIAQFPELARPPQLSEPTARNDSIPHADNHSFINSARARSISRVPPLKSLMSKIIGKVVGRIRSAGARN